VEKAMKQKKKLLVTASTFPRWEGDTEPRFVLDLAAHMAEQFQVTVLVPAAPGAKDREVLEGVKVIRYHYFPIHKWETLCYPGAIVPRIKEKKVRILLVPFLFLSLYFHLWRILPDYDIIHAHWLIPQGIVHSLFKKPYIVTGHGGDVTSLNGRILRELKIKCLRRAKYVTVVSEYLKNNIKDLAPDIQPEVISMGVDLSRFGKQYREENYFGQGDKKVVLFVGRLAEKKGVTYLLEAMVEIDALLVVVGDGPLREELKAQAEAIKEKVVFLGAKTHDELRIIYASADIFVCPSVTGKDGAQEGLGLVILEAMASGVPVVASRSGGIVQLIVDGTNGLLFEERQVKQMRNKINQLIYDKELCKQIKDNMQITVDKFNYKEIALKYAEIIKSEFK
jgi:glycosyltransferase involved in cell wall biosynthesis